MRRFLFLAVSLAATAGLLVVAACSSTSATRDASPDEGGIRKDGGPVLPPEGGAYDAAAPAMPEPACGTYCDLVMESCKDDHAQYASKDECLEICKRLPPGDAGDMESNSVACRQYYAGSPARTSAPNYCAAAGPFGGGVCGDRCPIFCDLSLTACAPDAGNAPFAGYPECQTACSDFAYREAGVDGGGEPPDGPESGDTLNCRLYHLRAAIHDGSGCTNLGADSGACR